jgi:hypothetical protein
MYTADIRENHRPFLFALLVHVAMIERERELKLAGFKRFASKDEQLMSLIT